MAEIRFNYGDKFTQPVSNNIGIGSTIPAVKLDVAGGASAGSLRVSGIASLSSYQGFVNTKLTSTDNIIVDAGQSGSVSGEVVIGTGQTISVSTGATTGQGGIQSLKVFQTFMPPVGGTADRPTDVKPGMVYYNKDFKTIEFWDGNFWKQVDNTTRSSRAIITSGIDASSYMTNQYDFITITSLGNSVTFGDMIIGVRDKQGCGSAIRAIFGGGADGSTYKDAMDYVTIAVQGNAIDFGDLSAANVHNSALSSSTRGIWGGGYGPSLTNLIEYVEISTLGDTVDFGDLSGDMSSGTGYHASCSSPVRGVFAGGTHPNSPAGDSVIRSAESITISSKGNSTTFAQLHAKHQRTTAASNGIRGLVFSGRPAVVHISAIDMSSGGNAVHFGDLAQGDYSGFSCCNQVRAVHGGGDASPRINRIEFVSINTFGNAQNFGELSGVGQSFLTATSDSHGGLGGF